jgi:hypothetical protein
MDELSEVFNIYIATGEVKPENLSKLLQYLQKYKGCEFTMKYTGRLPVINTGGYTVGIKSADVVVLVSMITFMDTIMLALAKYRTQIL